MNPEVLPVGKIDPHLLSQLISLAPTDDSSILVGPGIGLDCAVIDLGQELLVLKSDPITFVSDEIGWYLVQVNANDIVTTGATPRWLLVTVLLPAAESTARSLLDIVQQVFDACRSLNITVIGGHTEITHGLDQPILVGTMIGQVGRDKLITPTGVMPGNHIIITKGVPIEAISILAREHPDKLSGILTPQEIEEARNYLTNPGISILKDARIALETGNVTAMHDPTEGGLATALWEMAEASGRELVVQLEKVPISCLACRITEHFQIDPMASISSGALLFTLPAEDAGKVCQALKTAGIKCAQIGQAGAGDAVVWNQSNEGKQRLRRPDRDELSRLFD